MSHSIRNNKRLYGYLCGILSGVAYGTNPLFALPLITEYQMPVDSVLFYRYGSATICMFIYCLCRRTLGKVAFRQFWLLIVLGILFSLSSLCLFNSYNYIPSGIATTIIYTEPVLVAIIMVAMKKYPTWQKWLAIAVSFIGVVFLCQPDASAEYHWLGFLLAFLSALSYAFYLVIVNCSKRIKKISASFLGMITLAVGSILFFVQAVPHGIAPIIDWKEFGLVMGLGLVPTVGSLVTMTYATRTIGATTTAILGVMEPITAICIGVALFSEPLTIYIILGFVITASAIIFMTYTDKKADSDESQIGETSDDKR
ncbi:MAG: DMT family transporter [Proteobacteria bacterium]|nr:DMT family transporter [Pseudomonadota bacterium]